MFLDGDPAIQQEVHKSFCFDYNCSEGSVCLDYRCTPQPQAGDACSRDTHCTDGFVCGPDQACQARVASGEACDRDPICAEGLLCVDDQCFRACFPSITQPPDVDLRVFGQPDQSVSV